MSDYLERVIAIVSESLGVEAEKVTEDASFTDDLDADSLDVVELIMVLEEQFGVTISDEAAMKIETVGDAVSFLERSAAPAD